MFPNDRIRTSAYVGIITHNCPDGCLALLEMLAAELKAPTVHVFDNCSDADYKRVRQFVRRKGWTYSREETHQGEGQYGGIVRKVIGEIRNYPTLRNVLLIQNENGLDLRRALHLWEKNEDPDTKGFLVGQHSLILLNEQATLGAPIALTDTPDGVVGAISEFLGKQNAKIQVTDQHKAKKAAFLVATHHRPTWLSHCLWHLTNQTIPVGWELEIIVGGQPDDPGRRIAAGFAGVRYIDVDSPKVTDKLNRCLWATTADLVLLADDDDLQPPNRMAAAVRAYEQGGDWAASGSCWFYHIDSDEMTSWTGDAERGLVGTTLSAKAKLLRDVGGWPSIAKGKDGPLAKKLRQAPSTVFKDLTADLTGLVCLQHNENIWRRAVPPRQQPAQRGGFKVVNEGTLGENLSRFPSEVQSTLLQIRKPEFRGETHHTPVRRRQPLPPASGTPFTCGLGGAGVNAFIDGIRDIGFENIELDAAKKALDKGLPVLFHGWKPGFRELAHAYPALFHTLWHSGFAGSDLMGEGTALQQALECAREGKGRLVWLEERDIVPPYVLQVPPVWSPARLATMGGGGLKKDRDVMVCFHSHYPSIAKNVLAMLAGCARTGATLHLSNNVFTGPRGDAAKELLAETKWQGYDFLNRNTAVQLLSSMTLLCHVSLTDTWPYLVMESVYAGTPVVVSDAIHWAQFLSPWAQSKCIVRPATSSKAIYEKVNDLLNDPQGRVKLLKEQRAILDQLAPDHAERAKASFREAGFNIATNAPPSVRRTSDKSKILLLSDVRGWAFDINLRDMAEYIPEFDFDFWYVVDRRPLPDAYSYDAVYAPYHRWNIITNGDLPKQRALGSLRSWWFTAEKPEPPGPADFQLVNSFRAFHVVTQHNYDELRKHCPRVEYLTNPVNMRRIGEPTQIRDKVIASWNGNAQHSHHRRVDVKGFWSIVQPACQQAGVPLEFAEYNTKRVAPADMPSFYRKANLAVCASLYEGASNSVMEAMGAGQALIAPDVGNIREMRDSQLKHLGDTGIVLVERSVEAIAAALTKLKDDPSRVAEMGRLNRIEIQDRWSWDVWKDRYRDFLRKAL